MDKKTIIPVLLLILFLQIHHKNKNMKTLTVLISIALVVVFFAACSSDKKKDGDEAKKEVVKTPEDDAKEMISKIEKYTKVMNDASADGKIDDVEVKNINNMTTELNSFQVEIEKKYANGSAGKSKIDAYLEKNKAKMETVYGDFMNATEAVTMCEGFEKLNQ